MTRRRGLVWFLPFVVLSAVHVIALLVGASAVGADAVSTPTKWLLMPLLALAFLGAARRPAPLVLLAILFSWAGDVLIGLPGQLGFLLGLGSFAVAHVCYLLLFLGPLRRRRMPWLALLFVAWWGVLLAVLAPHLGALLLPVVVYGALLGLVASAALGTSRTIAGGALLFLASDTLLAFRLFLPGFDSAPLNALIMLLYCAGQGLIVWGACLLLRRGSAAVPAATPG